jgi:hypothetical protein
VWSRVSRTTLLHKTALSYLFCSVKGTLTRSNGHLRLTRQSQLNHTWCLWKKQVDMQDAFQTIKRDCAHTGSGSPVGRGSNVGRGCNVGSGFNVGSSYICDALVGHGLTRGEMCRDGQHTYLEGVTTQAANGETRIGIIKPLPLTVRQRTHLRRRVSESEQQRPRKTYPSTHVVHGDVPSCDGIICETSPRELWRKAPPQGLLPHTTEKNYQYSPCIPGEMPTPSASVFTFDATAGQWVRKRGSNTPHAKIHIWRELLFQ